MIATGRYSSFGLPSPFLEAKVCFSQLWSSRSGKSSRECPPRDSVRFSAHTSVTCAVSSRFPQFYRFQKIGVELTALVINDNSFIFLPQFPNSIERRLQTFGIAEDTAIIHHQLLHFGAKRAGLLPVVRDLISVILAFVASPAFAGSFGYSAPDLR